MKKKIFIFMACLLYAFLFSACSQENSNDVGECVHSYTLWSVKREPTCTTDGLRSRQCRECGYIDNLTDSAFGHTEATDVAVEATCTETGLTEGKHCSVCNAVIAVQETVPALGHVYDETVIEEATCIKEGTKQISCLRCQDSYTESITLKEYSASEIYEVALPSIGEIVTYDRTGTELAIGTGFVYSEDGAIVTNYHVIKGAYAAKITIDNVEYVVQKVLKYDKNKDLAILEIDAVGLKKLNICTEVIPTGRTVYAFGSSKGLTATFSQGIVTHSNREMDGVVYIQHDAAISSGNSGGPLINQYCEIVGINTMTLKDSQNLNFAIAAIELDKLTDGTPLTMTEFYKKEGDAFTILKNHVIGTGEWNAEDKCWEKAAVTYSDDYSEEYMRYVEYYPDDKELQISLVYNSMCMVTIYISEDGEVSAWSYLDMSDNYMVGVLDLSTFSVNTKSLAYVKTNISSGLTNVAQKLSAEMAVMLVEFIDYDFGALGVSARQLGFINF